jgi:hypothetical protein
VLLTYVSDGANIGVNFGAYNRAVGRLGRHFGKADCHFPVVASLESQQTGWCGALREMGGRDWVDFATQREQAPSPQGVNSYTIFGRQDREIAAFGRTYADGMLAADLGDIGASVPSRQMCLLREQCTLGTRLGGEPIVHSEGEEYGLVTRGTVELTIDGQISVLNAGGLTSVNRSVTKWHLVLVLQA